MVVNSRRPVYGVVDEYDPNVITYTGKSTSTADVDVDNNAKTIRVIVNVAALLGETSQTAYSGAKGAQLASDVSKISTQLADEIFRAVAAEQHLDNTITRFKVEIIEQQTNLINKIDLQQEHLDEFKIQVNNIVNTYIEVVNKFDDRINATESELNKVELQLYREIDKTEDNLYDYMLLVEDRIEKTTTQTVANNKIELVELIEKTDAKLTKDIRDVEQASIVKDAELNTRITQTTTELNTSLQKLRSDFDNTKLTQENKDVTHDSELTYIKSNYATKEFVDKKLVEFSKLSKQIADSVDVENDVVIIKGETVTPLDGVVYLVADVTTDGESTYKQYTVIDGDLVLIGDTKINLDDYATKEFVTEQIDAIPEVDLTNYAKKSDLPDVSTFISSIPEEYVTEDELTAKGYITEHQDLSDYASKVYVQAQIAKVGTLTKQIVDSIDVENKTVIINGVSEKIKPDVIYLILEETGDAYQQYTLIDGIVTALGTTSADLKNYATQEYVDEKFNTVSSQLSDLLTNLKFIDGGTSSSLNI